MTKVQVYFLAACVVATPHLPAWLALVLACVAGFLLGGQCAMATECQSNCHQGRKPCPCPEACEMPIQFAGEEPTPTAFAVVLWICCCIAVLALVSFIAGLTA